MRLGAQRPFFIRIKDDDVCIRTGRDRSLLWEHPEHLGAGGGDQIDPFIQAESPFDYTAVINQRETILHARPAVGDLSEITSTELFLAFEVERAVVRADFLQIAELQPLPQRLDVLLWHQWRGEDVLGPF